MMNRAIDRTLLSCRVPGGVIALSILLCGSAGANDQNDKADRASLPPAPQSQKEDREQINRTPSVLVGDVVEIRNVNVNGQPSPHRLVKLELQDGNTAVVDAGIASSAQGVLNDIEQGDRIIAVGRTGRINDRPVLVARSVGELHSTGIVGSKRKQQ